MGEEDDQRTPNVREIEGIYPGENGRRVMHGILDVKTYEGERMDHQPRPHYEMFNLSGTALDPNFKPVTLLS